MSIFTLISVVFIASRISALCTVVRTYASCDTVADTNKYLNTEEMNVVERIELAYPYPLKELLNFCNQTIWPNLAIVKIDLKLSPCSAVPHCSRNIRVEFEMGTCLIPTTTVDQVHRISTTTNTAITTSTMITSTTTIKTVSKDETKD